MSCESCDICCCCVQVLLVLFELWVFCSMICSSRAQDTSKSYTAACSVFSPSCLDVFSAEFDESKLDCNDSSGVCQCQVKVLDLSACVLSNVRDRENSEKGFNLVVTADSAGASKYTRDCHEVIQKHGPCKLLGIIDSGFKITATEIGLTAAGVGFEVMSAYQMVRLYIEAGFALCHGWTCVLQ